MPFDANGNLLPQKAEVVAPPGSIGAPIAPLVKPATGALGGPPTVAAQPPVVAPTPTTLKTSTVMPWDNPPPAVTAQPITQAVPGLLGATHTIAPTAATANVAGVNYAGVNTAGVNNATANTSGVSTAGVNTAAAKIAGVNKATVTNVNPYAMSSAVNRVTDPNSAIMQRAAAVANESSNAGGLLNSSMAIGAARNAVLNSAIPIASGDVAAQEMNANSANTVGLANANSANTVGMSNVQQQNAIAEANANAANTVGLANANAKNTVGMTNAQQRNAVALANANAANTVGLANANAANTVGMTNANAANTVGMSNVQQQNAIAEANAQQANTVGLTNAQQQNAMATVGAQLSTDVSKTNSAAANAQTMAQLDQANKVQLAGVTTQYQQVINGSANASALYNNYMQEINTIQNNSNLDATSKSTAIAQLVNKLQDGLSNMSSVYGLNLSSGLNFNNLGASANSDVASAQTAADQKTAATAAQNKTTAAAIAAATPAPNKGVVGNALNKVGGKITSVAAPVAQAAISNAQLVAAGLAGPLNPALNKLPVIGHAAGVAQQHIGNALSHIPVVGGLFGGRGQPNVPGAPSFLANNPEGAAANQAVQQAQAQQAAATTPAEHAAAATALQQAQAQLNLVNMKVMM